MTKTRPSVYRILFLVFCGVLVLGQLQRVNLSANLSIYLHEAVLGFFAFLFLRDIGVETRSLYRMSTWFRSFCLFCSIIGVTLATSALFSHTPLSELKVGVLYAVRFLLYASLFLLLRVGRKNRWILKQEIWTCLVGVGVSIGVLGFFQYILLPDTRFLVFLGWDDHYYRLISTLFDPAFTGTVFAITILLLQTKTLPRSSRNVNLFLTSFLCIALLLTYSRASYLSFMAGMSVLWWKTRQKRLMLITFLFVLGIFLLPRPASEGARLERTKSISSRGETLFTTMRSFDLKTLLIGKGWYVANASRSAPSYALQSHSSAPDNSYLHVLQSTGIFGLLSFGVFCWLVYRRFCKSALVCSVLVAVGIGSFFNNLLFYPWIMVYLWGMIALEMDT